MSGRARAPVANGRVRGVVLKDAVQKDVALKAGVLKAEAQRDAVLGVVGRPLAPVVDVVANKGRSRNSNARRIAMPADVKSQAAIVVVSRGRNRPRAVHHCVTPADVNWRVVIVVVAVGLPTSAASVGVVPAASGSSATVVQDVLALARRVVALVRPASNVALPVVPTLGLRRVGLLQLVPARRALARGVVGRVPRPLGRSIVLAVVGRSTRGIALVRDRSGRGAATRRPMSNAAWIKFCVKSSSFAKI